MRWIVLLSFLTHLQAADLIFTIPKSGTHMIMRCLQLVRQQQPEVSSRIAEVQICHFCGRHPVEYTESIFASSEHHRIVLIRDLRDVCVSTVHHIDSKGWYPGVWRGHPDYERFKNEKTFDAKLTFILSPGNAFFAAIQANSLCCQNSLPQAELIIRFEDLVGEQGGGSLAQQKHILESLFDHLQIVVDETLLAYVQSHLFGHTNTFRKGKIGSWKEAFQLEHEELFELSFGTLNHALGYQ